MRLGSILVRQPGPTSRVREYLQGLLLPRDRNKMLTALADAEPVVAAQAGALQRLQFFLSESVCDPGLVNSRRLKLLLSEPATTPYGQGVLVIDDSGDRKAGSHTAHVGRHWLGSVGKVDNGIVTVGVTLGAAVGDRLAVGARVAVIV